MFTYDWEDLDRKLLYGVSLPAYVDACIDAMQAKTKEFEQPLQHSYAQEVRIRCEISSLLYDAERWKPGTNRAAVLERHLRSRQEDRVRAEKAFALASDFYRQTASIPTDDGFFTTVANKLRLYVRSNLLRTVNMATKHVIKHDQMLAHLKEVGDEVYCDEQHARIIQRLRAREEDAAIVCATREAAEVELHEMRKARQSWYERGLL